MSDKRPVCDVCGRELRDGVCGIGCKTWNARPKTGPVSSNRFQRLCPHPFGWSYNTHRRRRFCRLCAHQQRRTRTGAWVAADVAEVFEPTFADQGPLRDGRTVNQVRRDEGLPPIESVDETPDQRLARYTADVPCQECGKTVGGPVCGACRYTIQQEAQQGTEWDD
jgi:hypothetical protein